MSSSPTTAPRVEKAFPEAIRPKELRGLALARSGETLKAQLVLGKLYAAGEIDPETLGIFARTWMDRYNQSGERLFMLAALAQQLHYSPEERLDAIDAGKEKLLSQPLYSLNHTQMAKQVNT